MSSGRPRFYVDILQGTKRHSFRGRLVWPRDSDGARYRSLAACALAPIGAGGIDYRNHHSFGLLSPLFARLMEVTEEQACLVRRIYQCKVSRK